MKKRPTAVIIIAGLLILVGIGGIAGDFLNSRSFAADHYESAWIAGVDLLAIVAGIFMLRGRNWARWLAVAWMAFHVAISFGHPLQQLLIHLAFLVLFLWILFFTVGARTWFGSAQTTA